MSVPIGPGDAVEAVRDNDCPCGYCDPLSKGEICRVEKLVPVEHLFFSPENSSVCSHCNTRAPLYLKILSKDAVCFCPCYFRPLGGDIIDLSLFRCTPVPVKEPA